MDLKEVKVCLRALLSSNPMSYHVSSLLTDFKNTTGVGLPLFGYLNPVEFLRSLDDTLKLKGDPYNPEVVLVESEKSAHIISLVDRQKANDKHAHRNPYFMPTCRRRNVVPVRKNEQCHSSNGSCLSFQNHSNIFVQEPPQKPPLQINETNIYGWRPSKPKRATPATVIKSQNVAPITQKTIFNRETAIVPARDKRPSRKAVAESAATIKTDLQTDQDRCYFEDVSDNDSCDKNNSGPESWSCSINSSLKNKLKKLIKKYPEGLWCCELPELFFEEYNFVLDYREYGCTSLIQMLSELPDVFRVVRPGNGDWILFDASVAPSEKEKKIVDFQSKGDTLSGIKANIEKLLRKFSDKSSSEGVELDKMAELYQKMFGTSLDVSSLGFEDVKSLLETWKGSILSLVNIRGKLVCNPASTGKVHSPVRWEEALPPITAENDIFAEIFPEEVSGPDETFAVLDLTRHIAVGHEVEVCVAEVWSPSKFFVQLNKYKTRLNQFMDDLQKFYNVHLTKYKMPDSTLRPNQICVALYNSDPEYPDEWHRAQIMKVINEKTLLINFVDYGTVTRVKKSQLRFLHRRFRAFPVQAIQAQLSGVAPPNEGEMWPMTTSKKFLELLRVPYLKAEMVDIDFKKPALSVVLYDPFPKTKSSINKRLVKDKLARARGPVYFQEIIPETRPPGDETNTFSENSSGALVQANESFTKNVPEVTDQFLDVDDLNYSPLLQFKMRSLTMGPSPSGGKKEATKNTESLNVSYVFEEIPELQEDGEEKEEEEGGGEGKRVETKKENREVDAQVNERFPESTPPAPGKEKPKSPAPPAEVTLQKSKPEQIPLRKPKCLPPDLEHVNTLPHFTQMPLPLQTQDLKKKVNVLAMELLTKNDSIKQVGVNDPALALRIATEMAEAYLSSEVPVNPPLCRNLFPLFSQPFVRNVAPSPEDRTGKDLVVTLLPEAPPPPPSSSSLSPPSSLPSPLPSPLPTSPGDYESAQAQALGRGSESKMSMTESTPPPSSSESNEYIEETLIGGKTLHVVEIDDEFYLSSEELVGQFTLFSNREIADRLLRSKKIKLDYRVLTKKSDSMVMQALKSYLPGIVRRRAKKLKIYLLPISKAVPFLQALGCTTKGFENSFLELQENWEGRKVEKAGTCC